MDEAAIVIQKKWRMRLKIKSEMMLLWNSFNGLFVHHDLCLVLSGSKVMIFFVIVCNVALLLTYHPFRLLF